MSDYVITISEALYDKARRLAEVQSENIDDLIRMRLENALDDSRMALPHDERAELEALHFLSDDALWTIAREQMPETKQSMMKPLMDKNTSGTLTDKEQVQLSNLVEQGQRLTLRKAEAMKLLVERGYTITMNDLTSSDDGAFVGSAS
jgi:hypothetical protein